MNNVLIPRRVDEKPSATNPCTIPLTNTINLPPNRAQRHQLPMLTRWVIEGELSRTLQELRVTTRVMAQSATPGPQTNGPMSRWPIRPD